MYICTLCGEIYRSRRKNNECLECGGYTLHKIKNISVDENGFFKGTYEQ